MTIIRVGGIDPGLIHTGIVGITLDSQKRSISVLHHIVDGPDVDAVVRHFTPPSVMHDSQIFIEKYRDRGTVFETHKEMRAFETHINVALKNAKLLDNTGVKKVVTDRMLEIIVGSLPTTNHRDLEAAARIGLYGALKDPAANSVVYHALIDHLGGRSWQRQ
jgi:hypothetical protein